MNKYGGIASQNDRIIGPLAAGFATIAVWEATRPVRWVNVVLGAWLLLAPIAMGYERLVPILNSAATGLLLIGFALIRGRVRQRFGGGWSSLWKPAQKDTGATVGLDT